MRLRRHGTSDTPVEVRPAAGVPRGQRDHRPADQADDKLVDQHRGRHPHAAVLRDLGRLLLLSALSRRRSPTRSVTFSASKYSASGMVNFRLAPVRSFHCCASIVAVLRRGTRRACRGCAARRPSACITRSGLTLIASLRGDQPVERGLDLRLGQAERRRQLLGARRLDARSPRASRAPRSRAGVSAAALRRRRACARDRRRPRRALGARARRGSRRTRAAAARPGAACAAPRAACRLGARRTSAPILLLELRDRRGVQVVRVLADPGDEQLAAGDQRRERVGERSRPGPRAGAPGSATTSPANAARLHLERDPLVEARGGERATVAACWLALARLGREHADDPAAADRRAAASPSRRSRAR